MSDTTSLLLQLPHSVPSNPNDLDLSRTLTDQPMSPQTPGALPKREEITQLAFHTYTIDKTVDALKTHRERGLSSRDAANRLEVYGLNELKGDQQVTWYKILWGLLVTPMTFILAVALALALASSDWVEAGVLLLVIFTNTGIGFQQEYQAEQTMDSLRRMASPTAKVLRNTTVFSISAREVVPGDIILFEEGDVIAADARLIECFHLQVDEAQLTGESVPVHKKLDTIEKPDTSVGDRINLVYSSTTVSVGRGKGIVIRTAMDTEIGKVAQELAKAGRRTNAKGEKTNTKTRLEKNLDLLAYFLLILVGFLALIVFGANNFYATKEVYGYALSVIIAVIPEGLSAVITITMALGVHRMAKQKAIVRKRMALEAIGSTTNICSDKTGTLTQGKMMVTQFFLPSLGHYSVSGQGYKPIGKITPLKEGSETAPNQEQPLAIDKLPSPVIRLVECSALCNMAVIKRKGVTQEAELRDVLEPGKKKKTAILEIVVTTSDDGDKSHHLDDNSLELTNVNEWEAIGDPTEAALQTFAWKVRLGKPHLASRSTDAAPMCFQLLQEFSFDATLKRMSVIYLEKSLESEEKSKCWLFCKGAVEVILGLSDNYLTEDGTKEWSSGDMKEKILSVMDSLASRGLRVLALGFRTVDKSFLPKIEESKREDFEKNLTFIGLVGIYDPPRIESRDAVKECRHAGIAVHMLTGDHPKTAICIAKEVGILPKSSNPAQPGRGFYAMTAMEFDKLTDEEVDKMETLPSVIARCSPTTKVKMVDALHRRAKIVAMTGDGTNDAPSLKRASVGIAMGMNGSDVAKQASAVVLTDDNFATIVKAVAEGRRIFANIQKFVLHLMSGNVAEIIALIIGLAFRDLSSQTVYPMSPVQILFLNMVTSSPPAMGLGMEPPTSDLMDEPPRDPTKPGSGLFTKEAICDIMYYGTWMGVMTLMNWTIVLFVPFNMERTQNHPLGLGCNSNPPASTGLDVDPGCEVVFRARATSFLTLTFLLLLHAYNCRSMRGSLLTDPYVGGWKSLKTNRFLLYSVFGGILLTIISVYIPKVNSLAFKQAPIDWEWGLILACVVVFMLMSEVYKLAKRKYWPLPTVQDEETV